MGLLGADAYSDDPASMARLRADVEGFRRAIVAYAVGHRAGLTAKYPIREVRLRDEVTRLIDLYNDDTQSEWTSSIVWDIAAEVYGRAIRVYSRTGPTFSVDASCEIEPTAIFSPQREPTGAPIHLMFYGDVHYCLLTRRMTG